MSVIKSGIWFVKGLREYTKGGFLSASKNFNATDLDVTKSDRSYMVTGANSGLGKEAALEIAKRGGTVHIVCRNKERGEQALQDIISSSGNQNIHLHQLDTSRPKDIYRFVQTFQSQGHSLDVLINNAGCMVNTRDVTEEGYEVNFATNTLGTHILTTALVPLLSKSSQPRVIIVSSGGMLTTNLNIDDLQFEKMKPFDGTMAYAQNKRQQIVMTEQYAKQYPDIHFSSMHPGWADTPAVRTSMPEFYEKMKNRLRTTEQGADTILWLAVSDAALSQPSGLFFQDRKNVPTYLPLTWSRSTQEQDKKLMSQLEEISKRYQSGTVHIVCRNKERGEQALQDIISSSGNQNIHLHQLDTSRPKDIYRFVQTFQSQGHSLDVLINNAGCMVNTRDVTEEGYEVNFATNTLGTHILTTALVPLLSKSSQPRVIIVSSGGMLTTNLNIDDLQFEKMKPFDGTMAYAQNKRQQIVMTEQYAKQYPDIHFSSMHPGWADTPAVRTSMPEFYEKMKNRLRTTEQGADTILWLAVSDAALSQPSGLFFQDRKNVPTYLPLTWSRSTQEQDKKLMSQLEEISKRYQSISSD